MSESQTLVCIIKLHREPIITSVKTSSVLSVIEVLGKVPQSKVIMYSIAEQLGATGVHLKASCNESSGVLVMLTIISVGGGKGTNI